MEKMKEMLQELKNNKKALVIVGVVSILIVVCLVFFLTQGGSSKAEVGTKNNDTKEQIENRKKEKVDKSILAVTMEQTIEFENGKSEGNLNIENMPENNYDIEVEITDDKREVIYESDRIEPGTIIRKDTLNKSLDKGSHLCTATFVAFDEDGNEVKRASAQIEITIKK